MRSIAPAARITSPHTSESPATEPAAKIAYSTNCPSTPALSVPASTSRAPAHSTRVIAPKNSTITAAVSHARMPMRCRAEASARVIAPA